MKNLFFLFIVLLACNSDRQTQAEKEEEAEANEKMLHIHLQDGFYQDSLVLYQDSVIFYEKVLTTREEHGYADKISLPAEEVKWPIHFRFVHQDKVVEGELPKDAKKYIGIYITSGTAVNVFSSDTPFIYHPNRRAQTAP